MAWLRGALSITFISVNTIAVCAPLYLMALLRTFLIGSWRSAMTRRMDSIIDLWVSANRVFIKALGTVDLQVSWPQAPLHRDQWYLVVSNHQTWVDVILLQTTLRPVVPPLKFFTKRQLIWLPLVGLAMKLLGFPYVRRGRSSGAEAERKAATDKDREATLTACAVFRNHPTSVLSFLEGTRFTQAKKARQQSSYQHLLNPKIGGLSYVLNGLAAERPKLVDVTISYPEGAPGFWEFLAGQGRRARMWIELHDLETAARQSDLTAQQARLGPIVEGLWRAKDARLQAAREAQALATGRPSR